MSGWKDSLKQTLSKRFLTSALAGALALSLGIYEFASPVRAASPVASLPRPQLRLTRAALARCWRLTRPWSTWRHT